MATLPATADTDSVRLITPAGTTVPLVGQELEDSHVVRYWQTHFPGNYRVLFDDSGSTASMPFHVARDPQESQLSFLDDSQRETMAAAGIAFGTNFPNRKPRLKPPPNKSPFGNSCWWHLLLCSRWNFCFLRGSHISGAALL